jgi:hypothetical protein
MKKTRFPAPHSGAHERHDRDCDIIIFEDCRAGISEDEHNHAIACLGRSAPILRSSDFSFR